jgi:heptosyltransferase-1
VSLLVVKTTSMGDVVHAMPAPPTCCATTGVRRSTGWSSPFRRHSATAPRHCKQVLPVAWRKWRKQLLAGHLAAMAQLRRNCAPQPYDLVLDLQGLLKSALWARQAIGPVAGYDRASAREPAACWFYQRRPPCRANCMPWTAAAAWPQRTWAMPCPDGPPDFGLRAPTAGLAPPTKAYSVLIPNASRREAVARTPWVAIGKRMREMGWTPWCCGAARKSRRWPSASRPDCEGDVPPFLKVGEMASVLAGARHVVGLDTGFTHLAAAWAGPPSASTATTSPAWPASPARAGGQHRRQGPGAQACRGAGAARKQHA